MARREKLSRTIENFEAAAEKLKESLTPAFQSEYKKDILIEIVTKRFEYTFESMWKCLKEILLGEGIQVVSPLSSFQEAFALGLISKQNEEAFPLMLKKRNEIVHIYNDEDAEEIYFLVKNSFAAARFLLLESVKKYRLR